MVIDKQDILNVWLESKTAIKSHTPCPTKQYTKFKRSLGVKVIKSELEIYI